MGFMVNLGLFEQAENGRITCMKLAKRLDDTNAKNPQIKQILSDLLRENPNNSETLRETPSRLDKIRLEEIREKNKTLMSPDKPVDRVPVKEIIDLYHQKLPQLPACQKITKAREGAIKQRWREDLPALENWGNYFDYIGKSPFLMGSVEPTSGRPPFRACLEWVCNAANYTKILEGKYHGV